MNTTVLPVAKAGQKVNAPVSFKGTIVGINKLTKKVRENNVDKVITFFSFDISGLPVLENTNENGVVTRATILRTPKQVSNDLDGFVDTDSSVEEIYNACLVYAENRDVELNVSAHEKGAITVVTENSEYAKAQGKIPGEEIEANSAGFYVEGFLDIDFTKEDRKELLRELKLARQAAQSRASSRAL